MKLNYLKNKRILILGMGREGSDTFSFLRNTFPEKKIYIADKRELKDFDNKTKKIIQKDSNIGTMLGDKYLEEIRDFDVIIKTPGISLSSIKKYLSPKNKITSQTDIFFNNCPSTIIGVTGTKGKSTTSSLIYSILKEAKFNTFLVGNIETPSLGFLSKAKKDDIFVYELSSHQLQGMTKSPHIAVFLNIYPEHLDYYKNMEEYFSAKANIGKFQKKNDYFIFNSKFKKIKDLSLRVVSKKIPINVNNFSSFFEANKQIIELTHIENLAAVLEVARIMKISDEIILKSFKKFKRPKHRLEFIGEYGGVRFYDDSIATIPEAAIFALDSLGNDVETLIAGGFDRGIKHNKLAKMIIKSSIKNLILFPSSGERIWKEIEILNGKNINHVFVDNMKSAVENCFKLTSKGKICLLSPASPSFGIFKDYKERGDLFKKYIKDYK